MRQIGCFTKARAHDIIIFIWPHRITASPPDSQSEGRGSIPRGAARVFQTITDNGAISSKWYRSGFFREYSSKLFNKPSSEPHLKTYEDPGQLRLEKLIPPLR